jgi:hypothetical protein
MSTTELSNNSRRAITPTQCLMDEEAVISTDLRKSSKTSRKLQKVSSTPSIPVLHDGKTTPLHDITFEVLNHMGTSKQQSPMIEEGTNTPAQKAEFKLHNLSINTTGNVPRALFPSNKDHAVESPNVSTTEKNIDNHPYRHLIYSPKIDEPTFIKNLKAVQRGAKYSINYLKAPSDEFISTRQFEISLPNTPQQQSSATYSSIYGTYADNVGVNKVLFLDLDETLIHFCDKDQTPDAVITINEATNERIMIKVRPYVRELLQEASKYY